MTRFFAFGGALFWRCVAVRRSMESLYSLLLGPKRFLFDPLRLFLFELLNSRSLRLDLCEQLFD